jgi:Variant SH3 domain
VSRSVGDGRDAVAPRDYDSTHLTVMEGEALGVLDRVGGDYLLCRNAAGRAGWVPESCVEGIVEGS